MISDFLEYERSLGIESLIPLLESLELNLKGKSVLDVGCGYGGMLAVLEEKYGLGQALGIDLDQEMIRQGRERMPSGIQLETGDFFTVRDRLFDFILMRDVLEHIVEVEAALLKASSLLKAGGRIYVSFAPFYSPFGGHQHNGSGLFANIPWLQLLPETWFRRLLHLQGNSYKSAKGLEADMETVLNTRLTLSGFQALLPKANLKILRFSRYLIRPDYRIKFGLPTLPLPHLPMLEELLCTGVEAVLEKG